MRKMKKMKNMAATPRAKKMMNGPRGRVPRGNSGDLPEYHAGVAAAEAERIVQGHLYRPRLGLIGNVAQSCTVGVEFVEVDRRRHGLMLEGGDAGNCLQRCC